MAPSVHTAADCVKFRHEWNIEKGCLEKECKYTARRNKAVVYLGKFPLSLAQKSSFGARHIGIANFQRLDIIETNSHEIGVLVA